MPHRMKIDNKMYEVVTNPETGHQFIAQVRDLEDAGRLMPNGMIWWFDPDSHVSQREQINLLRAEGRLEEYAA